MKQFTHFLNGTFVSEQKIRISPRDLGFARGYAVHDFIVTYNHKPFRLSEHIDRLYKSASIIGLRMPWEKIQIMKWAEETFAQNDRDMEKTMRIYVTGGESTSLRQMDNPTLLMMVADRVFYPLEVYEKGVAVKAINHRRPYPAVKSNFYIAGVSELSKPGNETIAEVIFYDDTQVFEGAGSNLFAVIDDVLITPATNIVEGITRNTILETVHLPIPVEVRDITFETLARAKEIFLTGSHSEVRGVVRLNEGVVGDGTVGTVTQEVARQYKHYISTVCSS